MRFILRIVAVLTMLLALTEAGLVTYGLFVDGLPSSSQRADSPEPLFSRLTYTLREICFRFTGPAAVFCYGATLFVLLRISAAQEEDVRTPNGTATLSPGRKGEP